MFFFSGEANIPPIDNASLIRLSVSFKVFFTWNFSSGCLNTNFSSKVSWCISNHYILMFLELLPKVEKITCLYIKTASNFVESSSRHCSAVECSAPQETEELLTHNNDIRKLSHRVSLEAKWGPEGDESYPNQRHSSTVVLSYLERRMSHFLVHVDCVFGNLVLRNMCLRAS